MLKYAKIIDDETKQCQVGTGTNYMFYASIGMTPMDVEQGFDGAWYLKVYAAQQSAEELAEQELQQKKAERADAVDAITVTVDGMTFDGDEKSQDRMARAITMFNASGLPSDYRTSWVLADSTIAQVSVSQLAQALLLAGQRQTELWIKPYES